MMLPSLRFLALLTLATLAVLAGQSHAQKTGTTTESAQDRREGCSENGCGALHDDETTTEGREGTTKPGDSGQEPGGDEGGTCPNPDDGKNCRPADGKRDYDVRDHLQIRYPRLREITGETSNLAYWVMRQTEGFNMTDAAWDAAWAADSDLRAEAPFLERLHEEYNWTLAGVFRYLDPNTTLWEYRGFTVSHKDGGATDTVVFEHNPGSSDADLTIEYTGDSYILLTARRDNELDTWSSEEAAPSTYQLVEMGLVLSPKPADSNEYDKQLEKVERLGKAVASKYIPGVSFVVKVAGILSEDEDKTISIAFDVGSVNTSLPIYDHVVRTQQLDAFGTGEPRWFEKKKRHDFPIPYYVYPGSDSVLDLTITADARLSIYREALD